MIDVIYQVTQTLALITLLLMVAGKLDLLTHLPDALAFWLLSLVLASTIVMSFISGLLLIWS